MDTNKIEALIKEMTLEEKASLCSGQDHWHSKTIERLGIPAIRMSDGPHGLRKQAQGGDHLGLNKSLPATCFPTATTLACSWDTELIKTIGNALGIECQAEHIDILLGPGANLKRSPLCGRNFEYFSEDPYLSSRLASKYIHGLKEQGVGASLKHFAANNQENFRFLADSIVDERTLRELYLNSFEFVVKEAQPATVMCAYNRLNGTYCSENSYLLTDVLRTDWGFEGFVISDWGAVNKRSMGLEAGLELEMPPGNFEGDKSIIKAVKEGKLNEEVLDLAVKRFLTVVFDLNEAHKENMRVDIEKQHEIAMKALCESIVLLKNEDDILPLDKSNAIAVIGGFAKQPRFQGGGSSYVMPYQLDSPLDEIQKIVGDFGKVTYSQGYNLDSTEGRYSDHPFSSASDELNETLIDQAVATAEKADIAVIFAGLPESYETEGYDRLHLDIPLGHKELIKAVSQVQKNTIVVLNNGAPVIMPWLNSVKGLIEAYLGGQSTGSAIANILFGLSNPCGKLAETFPLRIEDTPCSIDFLTEETEVKYNENLFIGYRYYDAKKIETLFPFGFGLSYTNYAYSNLHLDKDRLNENDLLTVSVDISNIGDRAGKEIVQLYIQQASPKQTRPIKELKAFTKISLEANACKTVTFSLDKRAFAYYDVTAKDWLIESGEYIIHIAKSSQDIILSSSVYIEGSKKTSPLLHRNSSFAELVSNEKAYKLFEPYIEGIKEKFMIDFESERGKSFLKGQPIRTLISYSTVPISEDKLLALIEEVNR